MSPADFSLLLSFSTITAFCVGCVFGGALMERDNRRLYRQGRADERAQQHNRTMRPATPAMEPCTPGPPPPLDFSGAPGLSPYTGGESNEFPARGAHPITEAELIALLEAARLDGRMEGREEVIQEEEERRRLRALRLRTARTMQQQIKGARPFSRLLVLTGGADTDGDVPGGAS